MTPTTTVPDIAAIKSDADIYFFSIALLFIGFTFCIMFLLVKVHIRQTLAFSVLAIASGLNLLGQAKTHSLFVGSYELFGVSITTIALYMLPVGMLAFAKRTINYRQLHEKSLGILWKVFFIHAVVMSVFDMFGICAMSATTPFFAVAFVVSLLYALIYKGDKTKKLTPQSIISMVGLYISALIGMIQGITMMASQGQSEPIFQYGAVILVISFMVSLLQQFKTTHMLQKKQAAELMEKNMELQRAKDVVDDLNRSLEGRVQDRTEQLTCANEELQAINDDLNTTMSLLIETQSQLVQSEKISALSTLVAGIAHEINTPIAAIQSNLQLEETLFYEIDYTNLESMVFYLQNIPSLRQSNMSATKRISDIIRDMKNFARLDESEYKIANINDGIESTITLLNHKLIEHNVVLDKKLSQLPETFCIPRQINQVMLILINNAIDAIVRDGRIVVSSEEKNNAVVLSIADNGCGIPAKNLPKIFNPGFTSKGVGVGTGLGLAIAFKIVELHKGRITVDSEEGRGSTFKVIIPIMRTAPIKTEA